MLFIKEQETTLNLRETIFRVKQGEDNHSYDVGNRPRGQSRPSGTPTDILSLGYLQGSTARPTQIATGWLSTHGGPQEVSPPCGYTVYTKGQQTGVP